MENFCEKAKQAAGGNAALAKKLGEISAKAVTSQAVSQWKKVPADRVLDVEQITGISRHDLRPDVFGEHAEAGAVA